MLITGTPMSLGPAESRWRHWASQRLKALEDTICAGVYPHRGNITPANDSFAVDNEKGSLRGSIVFAINAIRLCDLPPRTHHNCVTSITELHPPNGLATDAAASGSSSHTPPSAT